MSDIYVMQRANGDVFALDDHGRFCRYLTVAATTCNGYQMVASKARLVIIYRHWPTGSDHSGN